MIGRQRWSVIILLQDEAFYCTAIRGVKKREEQILRFALDSDARIRILRIAQQYAGLGAHSDYVLSRA